MARVHESSRVKRWFTRISDAQKAKRVWLDDFKVERSKRYWKGHQRIGEDRLDNHNQEKVVVNLIAGAVGVKIPSLYFYHPYARVMGGPSVADTPGTSIEIKAQLIQDTANTIVRDPHTNFKRETLMALKEAMWAFGVVEIGYSAEFVDNPKYKRPELIETEDVKKKGDAKFKTDKPDPSVADPRRMDDDSFAALEQIVDREQFYARRIPSEQFVVSNSGKTNLDENDWCGYYEWMYVEDVKKAPAYKTGASGLKSGGVMSAQYSVEFKVGDGDAEDNDKERDGQVKVWKIWDLRARKRFVIAEGHDRFLIEGKPYKYLPLNLLVLEEDPDSPYGIPPIFAMLSPQDEYNDSREMLRGLRKSIYPRYVAEKSIDEAELRKLETGGPGVIARVQDVRGGVPVQPINQPSYDGNIVRTLNVSMQDFQIAAASGAEASGRAEADTATQASIIDQRAQARESFGRFKVAEWLGGIIRGFICLMTDQMSLPMWIMRNVDPNSPVFMVEAHNIAKVYREITYSDLEEANRLLRWDVNVDVETLSPLTEDASRQQWERALMMLSNPAVATLLSRSPEMLKRTLDLNGIRSARDQQAISEALGVVSQLALMQQGEGGMAAPQTMSALPGSQSFSSTAPGAGTPTQNPGPAAPGQMMAGGPGGASGV